MIAVLGLMAAKAPNQSYPTSTAPSTPSTEATEVSAARSGPPPARLRGDLHTPTLLIVAERGAAPAPDMIADQPGVLAVESIGIGSLVILGRSVTAAAVDPSSYRRWASRETARADGVWQAVWRGELAVTHDMAEGLQLPLGGQALIGSREASVAVRLGAIATTVPTVDLMVSRERGAQLGIAAGNSLLVSMSGDAAAARDALDRRLGARFTVTDLTPSSTGGEYAARLVGGSVAEAVGSFRYQWFDDGNVRPDPAWVSANIVTGEVPILGTVTCHRVLIPQLRGALRELVDRGLAGAIDASDFGGCYVPRFIGRDPSRGLSLHTWGIAVDLNVATNQVGSRGQIDRRVVAVFARWGFNWGGAWRVPDPMHFELAALRRR